MTDYTKEADELINLVFDAPMNSATRQRLVADWLREFLAAREYGCTGLTLDPDGPELRLDGPRSDALASGAEVLADAPASEIDGFLEAVREREPGSADGYARGGRPSSEDPEEYELGGEG